MKCPVDDETLNITERQGVEIDYCPRCRGVWLDRGELDKIIDRAADELAPVTSGPSPRGQRFDDDDRDDDRYRRDDRHEYRPRKKKRSFLSEMFEFGD